MKAITDFASTREQIAFAVSVFEIGFNRMKAEEELNRVEWVEKNLAKAWFHKKREYWDAYSRGEIGDRFDRYRMKYAFQPDNYGWYEARLKDAKQLLQKFDCAVDSCDAIEVILSDKDLTLLSVSLQSALED